MASPLFVSEGNVGGIKVDVAVGDMTTIKADAYVVPQFKGGASYGGVGGAIANKGGTAGLEAYDKLVGGGAPLDFGHAVVTPSGGGNAPHLIHTVSVGSQGRPEFDVVRESLLNGLREAQKAGIRTVAVPAMGTGIIGSLTPEQSAKAMMSAVHEFQASGGTMDKVSMVIYGNPASAKTNPAFQQFDAVRSNGSYANTPVLRGTKQFDPKAWVAGMQNMVANEQQHRTGATPPPIPQQTAATTGAVTHHQTLPDAAPNHSITNRFLVVRASDLEKAVATLGPAIQRIYPNGVNFDAYPVPGGNDLVAIRTSDPKFYMGAGEEIALDKAGIPSRFVEREHLSQSRSLGNIRTGLANSAQRMAKESGAAPTVVSDEPAKIPTARVGAEGSRPPARSNGGLTPEPHASAPVEPEHGAGRMSGAKKTGLAVAAGVIAAGIAYGVKTAVEAIKPQTPAP